MVEHDPEIIKAAEWIVDIGPLAGKNGGEIVYSGFPQGISSTESITGKYLYTSVKSAYKRKEYSDFFEIKNATANNLKNVNTRIPKGVLTCITGVAGSGKSSLIHECFVKEHPESVVIDQSAIGKSSRANVATNIGVYALIRKSLQKPHKQRHHFQLQLKGACLKCNGQGSLTLTPFLDSVKTICDECEGKRYHKEVLDLRFHQKHCRGLDMK